MPEKKTVSNMSKEQYSDLDGSTCYKKEVENELEIMYTQLIRGTVIIKKISKGDKQRDLLHKQDRIMKHYLERLNIK